MSVLVLGSINTDLVIRTPVLPLPGETVLNGEYYQAHGGKGANQAVAAARVANSTVSLLGAVGNDGFGQASLEHLRSEGLDCTNVQVLPGVATGVALIMVDHQGENSIAVASGANLSLTAAEIDALPDSVFTSHKVFVTSLELPLRTVECGLARARALGLTTILNPAPAQRLPRNMLRLVDVLTPNEAEAQKLVTELHSNDPDSTSTQTTAYFPADELRTCGCHAVIVTLGSAGCLVLGEGTMQIAGHLVNAIDATAAGDCFNGVLAVALSEGRSLPEAVEWANAAAALSVTKRGAQPSLPRRAEIDRFIAERR